MIRRTENVGGSMISRTLLVLCGALGVLGGTVTATHAAELQEPPSFCLDKKPVTVAKILPLKDVKLSLGSGIKFNPADYSRMISLNGTWKCSGLTNSKTAYAADEDLSKNYMTEKFDDSKWDDIAVPLDWYQKYPRARFGKKDEPYVKGWYRKTLDLKAEDIKQQRVVLHFGVIGYEAKLYVNGKSVGGHHGDFTPWQIDVTDFVKPGKNVLALRVFSDFGTTCGSVEKAVHAYGSQWSIGNIRGGLWQDVKLYLKPQINFNRVLVSPKLADSSVQVDYLISNPAMLKKTPKLRAVVYSAMADGGAKVIADSDAGTLDVTGEGKEFTVNVKLDQPQLWTLDKPYLYYLTLCLVDEGKVISAETVRFGYRDFKVKGKYFYLNGERIYLFGENISSIGFGGRGATAADELAKIESDLTGYKALGYNMVRNAHMPILPEVLDFADRIGLMIYDEWAWSFTRDIIEDEFEKRNLKEVTAWIHRDYNHPSVVMWSCGNEVVHKLDPAVKRQLDKQVELVRKLDKSGRPAGSFSGSASWWSYGKGKLVTDFMDLHSYTALSGLWTTWEEQFNNFHDTTRETYQENGKFDMPYIIWECVGFSWGNRSDKNFRLNDIDRYAEYTQRPTNWANPNGIGFAGVIGLGAALDRDRGCALGRKIYGKRIIELIRYDMRVDGFAPWFHDHNLSEATIWNQPVFCGIRSENGIPIRNVFCNQSYEQEFYLVNSSNDQLDSLNVEFALVDSNGQNQKSIAKLEIPGIKPWEKISRKVKLQVPEMAASSRGQLRIVVRKGDKEVSRNFYDLYLQSEKIVTEKPTQKRNVGVYASQSEGASKLRAILSGKGVKYDTIEAQSDLSKYGAIIVPPGVDKTTCHAAEDILNWTKQGGVLLELEQTNAYDIVNNFRLFRSPQTFVDIAIPEHPIFRNLDQAAFDSWNNPEKGYVVNYCLAPFTTNALAVRMSSLGGATVANAVAESAVGKGRLLQSQLCALELWNVDSAATTYLSNLIDYTVCAELYAKARPAELRAHRVTVCPERLFAVDLKPYVNQCFTDDKANDGKGGWTDQGDNDFRMIPLGNVELEKLNFTIIDPVKNGGKSCIVLKGKERPGFPTDVTGMKIGKAVSRLFFLQACAWGKPGQDVGSYRINYRDGSKAAIPLVAGHNTADWWSDPSFMEKAFPAIRAKNKSGHEVGLFLASWDNPTPGKVIDSIDLVSAGGPIPILVAITAEKANPAAVVINNGEASKKWNTLSWKDGANNSKNQPQVEILEKGKIQNGVFAGKRSVKINMPLTNEDGQPVTFTHFDKKNVSGDDYKYLSFWVKPETNCLLEFVVPDKDWKKPLKARVALAPKKSKEWQKIRLLLNQDLKWDKDKFPLTDLRGEFFIYGALSEQDSRAKGKPMQFLIDDITLE